MKVNDRELVRSWRKAHRIFKKFSKAILKQPGPLAKFVKRKTEQ